MFPVKVQFRLIRGINVSLQVFYLNSVERRLLGVIAVNTIINRDVYVYGTNYNGYYYFVLNQITNIIVIRDVKHSLQLLAITP